jgi:large subunit ribosomal protein L4
MRQAALKNALSAQVDQVLVVADFSKGTGKTKKVAQFVTAMAKPDRPVRKVLIVLDKEDLSVSRSLRNLPQVRLRLASQLTTYDVLEAQQLIFTKESLKSLGTRLASATKTVTKKEA